MRLGLVGRVLALLLERSRRRLQGLHEQRPVLGGEPSAQHQEAVVVEVVVDRAVFVARVGSLELGPLDRCFEGADHALELRGGRVAGDVEEDLLGGGGGDAAQGAGLPEGDLASPEGGRDSGNLFEPARDPELVFRGRRRDSAAPCQPLLGRAGSVVGPGLGGIEHGEQLKESASRGVDMSGELSDGCIKSAHVRPARRLTFPARRVFGFRSHRRLQGSQLTFMVVTRYDRNDELIQHVATSGTSEGSQEEAARDGGRRKRVEPREWVLPLSPGLRARLPRAEFR